MDDEVQKLVETAEEHLGAHRVTDAAKAFEEAAGRASGAGPTAQLLRRAADAHAQTRSTAEAGRCYRQAAQFLDGDDRAECLMAHWRNLILEIAGCLYDCSFEWRGATDGSHDDDHDYYQGAVAKLRSEAEQVLEEALQVKGANRRRIAREARKECRRRQKDGWGAGICRDIVARATASAGV